MASQTLTKNPPSTDSEEESSEYEEEEEESSEEEEAVTPPPSSLRPPTQTKSTKAGSTPVPNKSKDEPKSSKRPAAAEISGNDSKKKKKAAAADVEKANDQVGTPLFKRLWTLEDEITILKGIPAFTSEKGIDPLTDTTAFYDYIKNGLISSGTRDQLREKIRKMRVKYHRHATKSMVDGKDKAFSNPHEKLTYHLSKDIWGAVPFVNQIKSNQKPKPVTKTQNQDGCTCSFLRSKGPGFEPSDENFMGRNAKSLELDEKWKNLLIAETELFLRRNEIIQEKAKLTLDLSNK